MSALHLIGLNTDSSTAHYRVRTGAWTALRRGVFVDADADIDEVVAAHAARIATSLYPSAYLSAASAVLLGPTEGGRLFLSSRRAQRTRIRSLEIVQNQGPRVPSLVTATLQDPLGDLVLNVSSPRQRFLEAFRIRSEHAASIPDAMRREIADRLLTEFGDAATLLESLRGFAQQNDWEAELEAARKWLTGATAFKPVANPNSLRLHVAWHGVPTGDLEHDGFEWKWIPAKIDLPSPVRLVGAGQLPPFLQSLLPEGWLGQVIGARDDREQLMRGRRYLSNIAIVTDLSQLGATAPDVREGRLHDWTKDGRFTGEYGGPGADAVPTAFADSVARLYAQSETPRLSGVQIKVPMHLGAAGRLHDASRRPFTHILKPAPGAGFEALPAVEWTALELAAAAGFEVPAHALVEMPDDLPPALVIERFDIRTGPDDRTFYCLEDFCSVLGVPPETKYRSTIERSAKGLLALTTNLEADLCVLFGRALFAWLVADGDMHLKNLALLKKAEAGDKAFRSVRMAPVYDSVTTRVFPGFAEDRMALKLNGKDDRLGREDFLALARTIGLSVATAKEEIDSMSAKLTVAAGRIARPDIPNPAAKTGELLTKQLELVTARCRAFAS